MDWYQVGAFIGVNIALFGAMTTLVIWAINKIDNDVKSIGTRVDSIGTRVDSLGNRLDVHAKRIDQMYSIILKILNDKK